MENTLIKQKVPDDFKRRLVACVNKALQDYLSQYLAEFQPDTKNAVPHLIGDWINKNIRNDLASGQVDIMEFTRYSWKGKVIIDRANRITYTIMRQKRFFQIRKEKRDRPHYLQTIVGVLNRSFTAPVKQMTFFGAGKYRFDKDMLDSDYDSIFCGCLTQAKDLHTVPSCTIPSGANSQTLRFCSWIKISTLLRSFRLMSISNLTSPL